MVAGRFAVMMDEFWKNRNDFIWHNEKEEAPKLGMIAFRNWHNWLTTQRTQGRENNFQNITNWNPPAEGWLKCNVDAGFNNHVGTTNRGWCIVIKEVVQAIHSDHEGGSEFSLIIMSIKILLHVFSNFEVKFIRRQANSVAHSLAKAANSWARRSVIHMIPPCIEHHVLNESH
ncbi:uncharacterized protein LOC131629404 [Vicia villosa]|uniref:uncharacterized protein LOC131629404 n=1 Tax=Vicia villosa TaxID=3911 RepID=UPI00273B5682|nr:uncharacterized protein LOC131629404 [Vicia villosa]